jgi:N6-adenosine-specific RNA methylase IME4
MRLHTSGPWTGLPENHYRCVLADPPWRFQNFTDDPGNRAAPYETMTLDAIKALPVHELVDREAWLFLWTSGPFLDMSRDVMRAWGFKFSTIAFTWAKLKKSFPDQHSDLIEPDDWHRGLGKTTRKNTELVLLGKLGSPRINMGKADELIVAPVREHSRKPDEQYPRIEALVGGPRIELFARNPRPGWSRWGNQIDRYQEAS